MTKLSAPQADGLRMLARGPAYRVSAGWAQAGSFGRIKPDCMDALVRAGTAKKTTIKGKLAAVITAAGRAAIEERKSA